LLPRSDKPHTVNQGANFETLYTKNNKEVEIDEKWKFTVRRIGVKSRDTLKD